VLPFSDRLLVTLMTRLKRKLMRILTSKMTSYLMDLV
jgi:hypothetical protein